jgi:hypothetical protein
MKLAVFLICSGVGYLLGHYLADPWSTYVSILVSYHLFLAFLLITADRETGFSFPILSTILGHAACLAILIGLGIGRRYVPFLGLVRMFVPALAPFECDWLFSGGGQKKAVAKAPAAAMAGTPVMAKASTNEHAPATPEPEYSMDDHDAWLLYLAQSVRQFRKPGLPIGDEFKQWRTARARSRAEAAQAASTQNENPG